MADKKTSTASGSGSAGGATVLTEVRGHVLVVTLNRPRARNAINNQMSIELRDAFERFRADSNLWTAVLAGNGVDFCAGADIRESAAGGSRSSRVDGVVRGGILRDFECWKPMIAAVQGNVLGGGLELALCCDLRIADPTACFGQVEVMLSRIPGGGGTQRLPRTIPRGIALEMILTGAKIDADRGERIGLVNLVTEKGDHVNRAIEMAVAITERCGPIATRRAKEAVYRGYTMDINEGMRIEELLARTLANTEDLKEGSRAFAERRAPRFEGR
jgi:enoyl-CoA hydratase/carnithine racemase